MKDTKECKLCNDDEEKKLCWKMQKAGLLEAVEELSTSDGQESKAILRAVIHSLETYQCMPCEKILERVKWTLAEVEKAGPEFNEGMDYVVIMVAEELKAFIT